MTDILSVLHSMKIYRIQDLVEVYARLEQIFATKGAKSLFRGKKFQHPFRESGTRVLGVEHTGLYPLRAGDLVLRSSKGKRLWKIFHYPEK